MAEPIAPTVRGRGTPLNPGNRFEPRRLEVLGEHLELITVEHPDGLAIPTRVYADRSRSVINRVDSPDLPFRWTLNPYRGCEHGCIYCYARPSHEMLGFSCGADFESRIVAKIDAPNLLREELKSPAWRGEPIMISGVTDPYQPLESRLRVTRAVLEVMRDFAQPISLITKNRLITRDIDILADLARERAVCAAISLTTLDASLARRMEPRASSPRDRLAAIRVLADAGVPVTVMTAPIIPGLNDHEIPALLEAAHDHGASSAGYILIRLPFQVKDLFLEWLARHFPDRASRVESLIRNARDGELNGSRFGSRFKGGGPRAEQVRGTFRLFARRLGLDEPGRSASNEAFLKRRAARESQLCLFDPAEFAAS